MGAFADILSRNQPQINTTLNMLSRMRQTEEKKQEDAARRAKLRALIGQQSQQTMDPVTASPDMMDAVMQKPQPVQVDTSVLKPGPFGGNAMPAPQLPELPSIGQRLKSIMSSRTVPRQFDEQDLTDMTELAGEDPVAQSMASVAEKVNAARAASGRKKYSTVSLGDGGYDILEESQDQQPRVVGGRSPRVKPAMTPYEEESLRQRREESERTARYRERQLEQEGSRIGVEKKQWVRGADGVVDHRVPKEGDKPYKGDDNNKAEFSKLRTKADQLEQKRNDIDNVLRTGVVIKNGKKTKLNVDDPSVKALLEMQLEQTDSALNDVYDQVRALEIDPQQSGKPVVTPTSDDRRERARKVLEQNGFSTKDEHIDAFLENNKDF